MDTEKQCQICNRSADRIFKRIEVWSNTRWRLTMSTYASVKGFCYLEPVRHIPYITDLSGPEASEFGTVLSASADSIKRAVGSKLVYVYIFGDHIPHLHVHLAPHSDGDGYTDDVLKNTEDFNENVISRDNLLSLSESIRQGLKSIR